MKKLYKLREWLTIEETAEHLSMMLGEPVKIEHIYRFALDGHLRLSVNFVNGTQGNLGKIVGEDEVQWKEFPNGMPLTESEGKPCKLMMSLEIDEDRYINLERKVESIRGIWDLMMLGAEHLDIEHAYQQLTGGPEITLTCLEGAFVEQDDVVCRLLESFDDNEFQEGSKAAKIKIEEAIKVKNRTTLRNRTTTNDIPKKKAKRVINFAHILFRI